MGCQCSKFDRTNESVADFADPYTDIISAQAKEYPLLVYSQSLCKKSSLAKDLLRKNDIQFEYFELEYMNDGELLLNMLQTMTGRKTTPFVFARGEFIGGYHELAKALEDKHLSN